MAISNKHIYIHGIMNNLVRSLARPYREPGELLTPVER